MNVWIFVIAVSVVALAGFLFLLRLERIVLRALNGVNHKKIRAERKDTKTLETVAGEIRNFINAGIRLSDFRISKWLGGYLPGCPNKATLNDLRLRDEKQGDSDVLYVSWSSLTSYNEKSGPVCWVSITKDLVEVAFPGDEKTWKAEISDREKVSDLAFRVGNYVRQFDPYR
jgi:hypothetical protein